MDSTELYRQLLGVTSPWTVERVEMSVHDVRVDVYLAHPEGARFACPECGGGAARLDVADLDSGKPTWTPPRVASEFLKFRLRRIRLRPYIRPTLRRGHDVLGSRP